VKVSEKKVVAIAYTLKDDEGRVLDSSEGKPPLTYLHGAGNIVVGLETALDGQEIGATVEVSVPPETGYGNYEAGLLQNVPVRKLPEKKPRVGMPVRIQTPQGPRTVFVKQVRGDYATLDGNHPLAGKTLHFKVSVVSVREPTAEELEHGHVHDPNDPHGH
jgi:FKBP-type peptidyl-prolyl cis-trans isomerase SlyD